MVSNQTIIPFPKHMGTGIIFRSRMPLPNELDTIQNTFKVRTIFQLCFDNEFKNQYEETLKEYGTRGFNVIRYSIRDFGIPDEPSKTWKVIGKIMDEIMKGNNVLIHCVGGKGRTGLILSLLAMEAFEYDSKEAIDWVRKFVPGAVETKQQVQFLVNCKKEHRTLRIRRAVLNLIQDVGRAVRQAFQSLAKSLRHATVIIYPVYCFV